MDLKLTGRTVLITGASKGIGLGIAKWFAGEGVHPRLVARSGDLLAKEAETIRKSAQVNVETMAADLSDPAARRKVFEAFPGRRHRRQQRRGDPRRNDRRRGREGVAIRLGPQDLRAC